MECLAAFTEANFPFRFSLALRVNLPFHSILLIIFYNIPISHPFDLKGLSRCFRYHNDFIIVLTSSRKPRHTYIHTHTHACDHVSFRLIVFSSFTGAPLMQCLHEHRINLVFLSSVGPFHIYSFPHVFFSSAFIVIVCMHECERCYYYYCYFSYGYCCCKWVLSV